MEFHVQLPAAGVDIDAIEDGLLDLDPAAVADLGAGGVLRVATSADARDIARVLAGHGHAVTPQDVVLQPSVCCGSCSG
ncbi:hypothetical protein LY625_10095 [Lysobacter sp. GX 14042]|uniref:hypothetical protein n=1 Tax=Lysobacter sp. GX 14042 TaxID=2907155 RepID=UPI001F416264|nr:hypothetical protein [Lysobacter sp. GX 14042]MCE7032958.1 hypothetical protein [Lysobacter sp. GX 14042]